MEDEQETVEETTELQTPTPEQQLEEMKVELAKYQSVAEEKDKGFKKLQQQLSEEQTKLRRQGDVQGEIASLRDLMKLVVASATNETEESLAEPERKQDLLKKFDEEQKRRTEDNQRHQLIETLDGYRKRIESLGFTEEDEEYWEIHDLAVQGNLKRADIKLKKMEVVKKETPKPEPTEEQIEEAARKQLEVKGLLKTETGMPSASGLSFRDFEEKYNRGEIPFADYEKRARREGKI